jgi:hypothetical protein
MLLFATFSNTADELHEVKGQAEVPLLLLLILGGCSAEPPLLARISHRLPSRNGCDAAETRRATEAAVGVLDSTSRRPTERNAVSASVSAVAAGNR